MSTADAAVAAIEYVLDPNTDEGMAFLQAWTEGNFEACRNEWPDAPESCYIGADPLLAETQELIEKEAKADEQAGMWRHLTQVGTFTPAADLKRKFWRGTVEIETQAHETFEEAMQNALQASKPQRKVE